MDYKKAYLYAKEVAKFYMTQMPVKSEYLHKRTYSLFLHILFDEIELYKVNKIQSSLRATTEFGISQLVCNIYTEFIRPMYFSLFLHDRVFEDNKKDMSCRVVKPIKRVRINTNINRIHLIPSQKK